MHMNTDHPAFSMTDELLCSLPMAPRFTPLSDLCDDLGLASQWAVYQHIHDLREHGIDIMVNNPPKGQQGRKVAIAPSSWGRARVRGKRYWKVVYKEMTDG